MSSLNLQLDESIDTTTPGRVLYRLAFVVTASVGIDPNAFVARVDDDSVAYVAAVRDLLLYPANKAQALVAGLGFYRVNAYALAYTTLQEAEDAGATIQASVAALNLDWAAGNPGSTFGGRQVFTYNSAT